VRIDAASRKNGLIPQKTAPAFDKKQRHRNFLTIGFHIFKYPPQARKLDSLLVLLVFSRFNLPIPATSS
jgi:hypothetical protein